MLAWPSWRECCDRAREKFVLRILQHEAPVALFEQLPAQPDVIGEHLLRHDQKVTGCAECAVRSPHITADAGPPGAVRGVQTRAAAAGIYQRPAANSAIGEQCFPRWAHTALQRLLTRQRKAG
mgnify:CR=1 FL=1